MSMRTDVLNLGKEDLIKGFAKWHIRVSENPEANLTREAVAEMTPEEYGKISAEYLISLVEEE